MASDSEDTLSTDTTCVKNLRPYDRTSDKGYLYLLQEPSGDGTETGFYKVGFSGNPDKRRKELQTGNPRKLKFRMVGRVEDMRESEKALKDSLSQYHVEGGGKEWYRCTYTNISEAFSRVCDTYREPLDDSDPEVQSAIDELRD